jgi:hypothetical protein
MTEGKRRTLQFASHASAVAAVLVVCAWVISYWLSFSVDYTSASGISYELECRGGGLYFLRFDPVKPGLKFPPKGPLVNAEATHPYGGWAASSIPRQLENDTVFGLLDIRGANFALTLIPFWLITALLLILPIWWYRNPMTLRRITAGICPDCGYDLRGSTDRCPECGRAFVGPLNVTPPPPARNIPEKHAPAEQNPLESPPGSASSQPPTSSHQPIKRAKHLEQADHSSHPD